MGDMKKLLMLLVISQLGWSQNTGQNVVNVVVLSNRVTTTTSQQFTSNPFQNIGQSSHTLIVSAKSPNVSGIYDTSFFLEGSIDGINWFTIGSPQLIDITNINTTITQTSSGFQSFPYLRSNITSSGTHAGTILNVEYVGSSAPSNNLIDLLQVKSGILNHTGTVTNPILGTLNPLAPSFGVGTNNPGTFSLVLYGININVPPTGITSPIIIGCALDSNPTIITLALISLPNPSNTFLSNGLRSLGTCPSGFGIYSNTAGTGTIGYTVQYRYE